MLLLFLLPVIFFYDTRNKGGHFIIIKGLIHQEDTTNLNAYESENRDSNHMSQKLIQLHGQITQIHNYSQRL